MATRAPTRMDGRAAGNTTRQSVCSGVAPNMRALRRCNWVTCLAPAVAFSTIGKKAPIATSDTEAELPMPKKMRQKWIQEAVGIGRSSWSVGSTRSLSRGERPIRMPSGAPIASATAKPLSTRAAQGAAAPRHHSSQKKWATGRENKALILGSTLMRKLTLLTRNASDGHLTLLFISGWWPPHS